MKGNATGLCHDKHEDEVELESEVYQDDDGAELCDLVDDAKVGRVFLLDQETCEVNSLQDDDHRVAQHRDRG